MTAAPAAPRLIAGRFEIEQEIAAGGMGRIYRARDRHTGARVAVKMILDPQATDIERFQRETVLLAEISHPSIVRYVAHGQTVDQQHFLVMEWLDGEDLAQHLKADEVSTSKFDDPQAPRISSRTALPPLEALALARKMAEALGELHRRGLVHRDVKPSNIFLVAGSTSSPKLIDFGIARGAGVQTVTHTGMIVGTPQYMAPEQARGAKGVGGAADVWALGCILFECVVGRPPFLGDHAMAVLAKILLDEPPRLRDVLPHAPRALDALLARLLAKDPASRPPNGEAAAIEIERAMREVEEDPSSIAASVSLPSGAERRPPPSRRGTGSISTSERRVHCVVIAGSVVERPGTEDATVQSGSDVAVLEDVRRVVEVHGGRLEPMRDGSMLVSLSGARSASDQATRAARVALAMRSILREAPFALVTGRADGSVPTSVGSLIDRAVATLAAASPGIIRVDPETAELLGARFELGGGDSAVLEGERATEVEERVLLGKPTPMVGRDRELRVLEGVWEECVAEPIARIALVTAPAGAGKSRLRGETLRRLRARGEPIEIFSAQGDSVSAGSSFVMIAPALRRSAGILEGEPTEVRREKLRTRVERNVRPTERARVADFLGELCAVPMTRWGDPTESESLRAARHDPMLMGDAMRRAFEDFLAAEVEAQPVLFVLEDLHWGDLPSVRFIDSALRNLRDAPFMVLALARPEVHTLFPGLWSERAVQEIRLDALSKRASERLVKEVLGERATPEAVAKVVERAAGNAFFLEELIRAVARGDLEALPDTVLATLQARLDALGTEPKRLLRAASVFGEVFWQGGVRALASSERRDDSVADWLDDLVTREIIVRNPVARVPGETEYAFRHALVRDAAYEMLTEGDRVLAHALAGEWLEHVGENDAVVLAEHFARGEEPARAAVHYRRAAEQALEGNDLAAVVDRAERALAALDRQVAANPATAPEPDRESRGMLRLLQAVASYWRSAYADARSHALAAISLLAPGTPAWFRAAAEAMVSSARRGEYDEVDRFVAEVRAAAPQPGAESQQIVALCRGTFQLIFAGRLAPADEILGEVTERARHTAIDPATRAQVHHVHGVRYAHGGRVGQFLVELEAAIAAFEEAGDTRNVALETPTLGWCYAELGDFARAEEILREAMARCERLGVQQTKTYAQVNLGYVLDYRGRPEEAERALLEAGAACRAQGNPRLEGWSRVHLARVHLGRGALEGAEREARAAEELLAVSPGLRAWARATLARTLLASGRASEARGHADRAFDDLVRLGSMLQGESLPPLVRAEVLLALGDRAAACAAIADARTRLLARANALPQAAWRESFLGLPDNARTLALASELGVS